MAQNSTYTRRINLFINGKEINNDLKSIKAEMARLVNAQSKMTIGSKEYVAHGQQIKVLNNILKQHRAEINETAKSWWSMSNMADKFNKYAAIFTGIGATLAGVVFGARKANDAFLEYDEKLADVKKTTGLTKDQVKALSTELSKIDTRTSQQNLLDLARVAGKLGISAEKDIQGFVKASDQIAVSLSEDLGGNVEESVNELGKLIDIFKLEDEFGIETAMLKIGSAINSLGAAGTANEGYLVEFSKRVAGIAPMANVTMPQILGLAATLDELGQTAEVSGTTYTQVVGAMFKDTATFAKMAGMKVADFTKLLNTDANEAFIKVLQGAKGTSGGFAEMAKNLDAMGLDGARSTAVLGVLANNIDKLRERQAYSNEEFEKGTSLTEEFNTKNTTATAELEKSRKEVTRLSVELGEKLNPYMTMTNVGFGKFLRLLMGAPKWISDNKGLLLALSGALLAYNAKLLISTALKVKDKAVSMASMAMEKANLVLMGIKAAALLLQITLTGKATTAQLRYIATAKAMGAMVNPWQLIIIAITAAIAAYAAFRQEQSKLNKGFAEFAANVATEKKNMNDLFEIVKKSKQGSRERAEAIKVLNDKYREYLPNLITEKSTLAEIEVAQKAANDALVHSIAIKSKQADIEAAVSDNLEVRKKKMASLLESITDSKGADIAGLAAMQIDEYIKAINESMDKYAEGDKRRFAPLSEFAEKYGLFIQDAWGLKNMADSQRALDGQISQIDLFYKSLIGSAQDAAAANEKVEETIPVIPTDTPFVQSKEDDKAAKEQEKELEDQQKAKENAEKDLAKSILDIRRQLKLDTLSEEDQEFQKIKDKYADLIATATQFGLDTVQLKALEEKELTAVVVKYEAERAKARQDAEAKIAEIMASDRDRAVKEVTQKYSDLIKLAEENGLATTELYARMNEELANIANSRFGDEADILGMTDDDWTKLLGNFDLVMQAMGEIGAIWGSINQIMANKEQSAFNKYEKNTKQKKVLLAQQLDNGVITQEEYNAKVAKLDADLDNKKSAMQRKAAERDKKLKVFQAFTSTAAAVIHMLADPGGIPGVALSVLAGITGAAQIAAIASEPLPEFADGGFNGYALRDAIYRSSSGRPFRAGEGNKKEWIGSNDMVTNPYTGPVIAALESVQRGKAPASMFATTTNAPAFGEMTASIPQYANGGYNGTSTATSGRTVVQQAMDITPLVNGINQMVDESRMLRQYMSDPQNRQAYITDKTLKTYTKEEDQRNSLARIK
jgi:TP901 family phage tail tape measure protein